MLSVVDTKDALSVVDTKDYSSDFEESFWDCMDCSYSVDFDNNPDLKERSTDNYSIHSFESQNCDHLFVGFSDSVSCPSLSLLSRFQSSEGYDSDI